MSFTGTDYYTRLCHFLTPESLNTYIIQRSYPSLSLDQYEKTNPTLPTTTDTSFNCMLALAKGVYHLFYAVVVGLPSDWLTLKTHVWNGLCFVTYPIWKPYTLAKGYFMKEEVVETNDKKV